MLLLNQICMSILAFFLFVIDLPLARASWQKQVSRPKGLTAAEVREKVPTDPSLTCPIDNKLFRDAVKTPCCGTLYCEECVQTHLLERDFICPNCSKKIASLDKLLVDKPTRTMVSDYIEKAIDESKKEGGEESPGDVPNGQQASLLRVARYLRTNTKLFRSQRLLKKDQSENKIFILNSSLI